MSRKELKRGTAQWAIEEIKKGECIIASSFSFRTKFMKGESNEGIIIVDGNDDSIVGHLSFDEFLEEYSSQVRSFEPYKNPPNAMVGDWVRSRESNRYYQIHDVFVQNKGYLYEIRAAGAPGRTQVIGEEDFGTFYLSSIYPDLSAVSEENVLYKSSQGDVTVGDIRTSVATVKGRELAQRMIEIKLPSEESIYVDQHGCLIDGSLISGRQSKHPWVFMDRHQYNGYIDELHGDEYYSTFNDSKEVTAKALIMKNWPNRCHERCPHAHNDHINRDYSCLLFDDDMDDPGIRCQSCINVFGAGEGNEQ